MATKETKDGLGYIIQAITNIIEPKVANLRYDKTYRAKVTGKRDIGIYNVEINRIEYQLNYSGNLEIGDIVRVKAPLNNFSDIYIETVPGSGGGSGGTENYNDLINKPVLNTNNTTKQNVSSNEIIKGTISLHKISKTGDYNDLNNKPSLNFIPISDKGVANGVATLGANAKVIPNQLPIASDSKLGVIKVGANLSIGADGTLNAVGGGTGGVINETVIGSIALYAGEKIPDGWLICNGQIVYSKDYPDLYKIIGNTYGGTGVSGDFQVPDLRDRVPLGLNNDAGGLTDFIGYKGGSATHTHTLNNAYGNMYIGSEYMYYNRKQNVTNNTTIRKSVSGGYAENARAGNESDITLGGTTDSASNMPPYIKLNYIIKAKETNGVIASVEDTLTSDSTKNALSAKQGKILNGMIESLGTYSTNEINTGEKWIDGKPIYRKVFTTTPTNTETNTVEHNISNVDKIWISGKSFLDVGGTSIPVNYYRDTIIFMWAHVNRGSYQYKISAPGWLNNTMYLIVEYTKTTD